MRFVTLSPLAALAVVGLVVGCSSNTTSAPNPTTRAITGQLSTTAYALDNAVVIARSQSGRQFLGAVQANGSFRVTVPTSESYRLVVANTLKSGAFSIVSRVSWSSGLSKVAWARLGTGTAVTLGLVHPVSSGTVATKDHGVDTGSGSGKGAASGSSSSSSGSSGSHDGDHDVRSCGNHGASTVHTSSDGTSGGDDSGKCDHDDCEDDEKETCSSEHEVESECDDGKDDVDHGNCDKDDDAEHEHEDEVSKGACPPPAPGGGGGGTAPPPPAPPPPPPGGTAGGGMGATCTVNADCAAGLLCIASTCGVLIH